jgi:hypothetical protein
MNNMERRRFLVLIPALATLGRADTSRAVRGKLGKTPDGLPALEFNGKFLTLEGDPDTVGVLEDARLVGTDFEVVGATTPAGTFRIDPIHKRALFTYKSGKRLMVTYWCDVCAIRTYTPGICWCCREDTALDLMEPDKVDKS